MKPTHIFTVFSFVLLIAMAACGPIKAPATLAPSPFVEGQINNNPGGPIPLATPPIPIPNYTPPAGCVQFGCAYPAVCDQTTGQCVINNSGPGPATLAPIPLGAGQMANNPIGPIQLAPTATTLPPQNAVCIPPVPSVSNANYFCTSQTKGLGGVSFSYAPTLDALDYPTGNGVYCDLQGSTPGTGTCGGPAGAKFQEFICTQCGLGSPNKGAVTCAIGSSKNASGLCLPPSDPNQYYDLCPSGSDWDNSKQACVDEKTAALNPQCPPGYPYFLPGNYTCASQPWQAVYDCQSFPMQLGTCFVRKQPSVCQPPAGGCGVNTDRVPKKWDPVTCSCK